MKKLEEPIITIKTKSCSVCKEIKLTTFFYIEKRLNKKTRLTPRCIQCDSVKKKLYYLKNKEKCLAHTKQWILNHKENGVNYQKLYRQTIPDSYARALLINNSNLKSCDIPNELVVAKKIQLQIRKYVKDQHEKC